MPNEKYTPISPIHFCRADLPPAEGVPDRVILKSYDGKVNGGVLYRMLCHGHLFHAYDFINQWMALPDYGDGDRFYRVWHVKQAFDLADKSLAHTRIKTDGISDDDGDLAAFFRERLTAAIMLRDELAYSDYLSADGGFASRAASEANAMFSFSRPLTESLPPPDHPITDYLTEEEAEWIIEKAIKPMEATQAKAEELGISIRDLIKGSRKKTAKKLAEMSTEMAAEDGMISAEDMEKARDAILKNIDDVTGQASDPDRPTMI